MLKAIAQSPAAPFIAFLLLVAVFGLGVGGVAALVARRGRPRLAGWLLIGSGFVFLAGGVLLFAPQPLWIGMILAAVGVAMLVKTPKARA